MGKALWKLVENAARFPRRGGRVLCVHGAVSFHQGPSVWAKMAPREGGHLGLGLRGRGQGQQRGGGQQGQAGPLAGAVRSLPGLATAPGSRKSPCPGGEAVRF